MPAQTLYGTTEAGGTNGVGTIFSINANGTGYTVLYSFAGGSSGGAEPTGDLTLVGSTLYGTTQAGGAYGDGTIFSINTDGTGYQLLYSLPGGAGGNDPAAGLALRRFDAVWRHGKGRKRE